VYSQSGFHQELAGDRQRQLIRDSGVEYRTASHVAALAADQRAELEAERRRALRFEPARLSVASQILRRLRGTRRIPAGV
jgi:hypothetical protein